MGQSVTDVGCQKKDKDRELKKHAATIHCSNTLSLLQRKVSNALLYHAYHELLLKEEHEITIKQLCRLIGYHGNNHAAIRDALKGLISTVIEWNIINDETGTENWTASSIIASVSLEGPLCYYAYSPRMKQLLHSPSMFGKIDLVIQSHFRSSYGLALYENCIRYRGLPYTKWFEIDLFKKLMGVPLGHYDIFRDFKRRVLDKAIDEVNTYSDLIISPELVREGRKVVRMRFKLKEREKKIRLGTQKQNNEMLVINDTNERIEQSERILTEHHKNKLLEMLIHEFLFSKEQARQILNDYDEEFIQNKIKIVKGAKKYREQDIKNISGYLLSALKNDYQPPKKTEQLVDLIEQHSEWEEIKQHVTSVRNEYQLYREKEIHYAISSMSEANQSDFMEKFTIFAEPIIQTILQLQRRKYSRANVLESPQVKASLRQFALRELDSLELISLEEFAVQQADAKREAWQKLKAYDPTHPLLRFNES